MKTQDKLDELLKCKQNRYQSANPFNVFTPIKREILMYYYGYYMDCWTAEAPMTWQNFRFKSWVLILKGLVAVMKNSLTYTLTLVKIREDPSNACQASAQ